jgi:hypothetical protein
LVPKENAQSKKAGDTAPSSSVQLSFSKPNQDHPNYSMTTEIRKWWFERESRLLRDTREFAEQYALTKEDPKCNAMATKIQSVMRMWRPYRYYRCTLRGKRHWQRRLQDMLESQDPDSEKEYDKLYADYLEVFGVHTVWVV